jgi:CheY-like chemotaxis protein
MHGSVHCITRHVASPRPVWLPDRGEGRAANPGPTVLVVEDDHLVADAVIWELEDAGYRVLTAASGEAALAVVRERRVDLLFTDIRLLDGMDGWRLAEEARQLRPGLPVIYTTGYTVEQPRLVPGSLFLHKPYRPSAVIDAAARLGVAPPD